MDRLIERDIKTISEELKKMDSVMSLILFGSVAKGKQKPISDIDICVITKRRISKKSKLKIASLATKKTDLSFFWDMPAYVRYSALKDGKIIFNKDKEIFHDVLVKTMSDYLDFKPVMERSISRVFGS